jgi:hypothetical protein
MSQMLHRQLSVERWEQLSLAEQLGHVGSEVSRALRWKARNPVVAQGAIERALELLDLTLDDSRHRRSVARLREIARAREVVVDFLVESNQFASTASSLQKYFDAFAKAGRRGASPGAVA